MGVSTTSIEHSLRDAGLRITAPRTAVLEVLREHPHADAASVVDGVRALVPTVSRQAVFDCLNTFVDVGLARRIQPEGSPARYEIRRGDNHHHLVCRDCGVIVDVDCVVGAAPCLDPSHSHGFTVTEAEVIYWGRCPDCSTIPAATPERGSHD